MTTPQGGLAPFGMAQLNFKLPAGRLWIADGNGSVGAGAQTLGQLRLAMFFVPFRTTFVSLGHIVTVAGAAGTTITPVIYGLDGNGLPTGNPIVVGSALVGDATGTPLSVQGFTLAAGWYWGGGLPLVGNPSTVTVTRSGVSAWGSLMPSDGIATGGTSPFVFIAGLGAIPVPLSAYTLTAGQAPALVLGT